MAHSLYLKYIAASVHGLPDQQDPIKYIVNYQVCLQSSVHSDPLSLSSPV